jgi:TolB protein
MSRFPVAGLLALPSLLLSTSYLLAATPRLAFERGTAIWIANADGSDAHKLTKGSGPDLSPDGTRIAFNTDESNGPEPDRQIALVDLATKKVTTIKGIPSRNCQRAAWSPDGKRILFSIWTGDDWHLALIGPDGSDFRYLKKASSPHNSFWSTCWAPDGNSIYAQDLSYLYQFDLQGQERKKWKLEILFPNGSMNSGSTMACSPNGGTLLVELDMDDEEANLPDWEGPPPALWTLDLGSMKATRLTPKGLLASSGCWLDATHVLFTAQSPKEKQPVIEKMDVGNKEMKLMLKDARDPKASRGGS